MSLLITNARIADCRGVLQGDIFIEDGVITEVGRDLSRKADATIDASRKAAIPGLVNAHTHAAMVLFRGYADDMALAEWLQDRIWPLEQKMDAGDVCAGARLACLEMAKSGTTAFNDMYFFSGATARAAEEVGLRCAPSEAFFDAFGGRSHEEILEGVESSLARTKACRASIPSVGPHAPYTVSLELLGKAARLAERHGALLHFHLAETKREVEAFRQEHGKGVVEALDEVGFLGSRLVAAHSIWLDEEEMQVLAERGASACYCPASNMKLGSGCFDYAAMKRAGVNIALGTDGAASNNSLDMFETMKLAALLQKHHFGDPARLSAREAFEMATLNGAKALGLKAGLIEPGYLADICLLDLSRPCFYPGHDLISDMVYSAKGDCVDTVLVGGKVVMKGGMVAGEKEIAERARKAASLLIKR